MSVLPGDNLRSRWARIGALAGLAACLVLAIPAAAASASQSNSSGSSSAVPSLEALVPAAVRQVGTVTVPVDSDYPPFEYLGSNGVETGLSADLMRAAFALLGLTPKVEIVDFDSIIPGFAAKRYLTSMASINVTPERAKVVDFVTYDRGGDSFYENSSSTLKVAGSYAAICGQTVAVEEGSEQASTAEAEAAHCKSIGKPANILQYTAQASVNLAVQSNRAAFGIADNATVGYLIKVTDGKFKLAAPAFNFTSVTGWAVAKTSGLAVPLQAALKYMISHGTYQAIFDKWGLESGELANPQIVS